MDTAPPAEHPFIRAPHRTFVTLSFPVLVSLVAEPLTGLADTAFVAALGAAPLAALGVGTMVLSSVFWIFNFLGISTQTEVARSHGAEHGSAAAELTGLALLLSLVFGAGLCALGVAGAETAASAMGADGTVATGAAQYLRIRSLGAPAVLATVTAFGALRGRLDMRTPLCVALAQNALNIGLDAVLVQGLGPIPAYGIAGAAWASVASQVLGAVWAVLAVRARLGFPARLRGEHARHLLVVGSDLFVRTGLLTLFLLLATRAATRIGPDAGAAHQAVRQVWVFTALLLDAYAATAQSLCGYFLGSGRQPDARRVAFIACAWSCATGAVVALAMLLCRGPVAALLVPPTALALFGPAWTVAAVSQPLSALSFATDGIHWGTRDYRFLRNAMVLATGAGALLLQAIDEHGRAALTWVWLVTASWIAIRAALGVLRVWPGIGASPLARR